MDKAEELPVWTIQYRQHTDSEDTCIYDNYLPLDEVPSWSTLQSLGIFLESSSGPGVIDLKVLLPLLASTSALEELHFQWCPMTSPGGAKAAAVQLPRLQRLEFTGEALDFKILFDALEIPMTAVLDLSLFVHIYKGQTVDTSFLSSLIRAHSDRVQQEPRGRIHEIRLQAYKDDSYMTLEAWPAHADPAADKPLFHITLFYVHRRTGKFMHARLALLCQNIAPDWVRHLSLSKCLWKCSDAWDRDTWRALFADARSLEKIDVEGCYAEGFFEAVLPMYTVELDGAPQSSSFPRVLFPSLREVHLFGYKPKPVSPADNDVYTHSDEFGSPEIAVRGFDDYEDERGSDNSYSASNASNSSEEDGDNGYTKRADPDWPSPTSLAGWLAARAEHAPISVLRATDCSDKAIRTVMMSNIKGLTLSWDVLENAASK